MKKSIIYFLLASIANIIGSSHTYSIKTTTQDTNAPIHVTYCPYYNTSFPMQESNCVGEPAIISL